MYGSGYFRNNVLYQHEYSENAICTVDRCVNRIYSFDPDFGAFIGCVIGTFLILMVNPMQAIGFIVLFLVLQQVEGNLIYPHVVGGSVGLPSMWVLVAVSLGGSLMGLVGMLIFIPMVSVIYTLFRGYVYERLRKKNITVFEKKEEKEHGTETEE